MWSLLLQDNKAQKHQQTLAVSLFLLLALKDTKASKRTRNMQHDILLLLFLLLFLFCCFCCCCCRVVVVVVVVVVVTSTTNRFGDEVVWIDQSLLEKT